MKKKPAGKSRRKTIVAVSGGFDPIHVGHVRLFRRAKALGDELVVILNNDNWLKKKKGFTFMPQEERKELLEAIDAIDRVVITGHPENPTDMSVSAELLALKPHIFANGGDRDTQDARKKSSSLNADQIICGKLGIKMVFSVGRGGKVQSSSWLLENFKKLFKGK